MHACSTEMQAWEKTGSFKDLKKIFLNGETEGRNNQPTPHAAEILFLPANTTAYLLIQAAMARDMRGVN